MEDHGSEKPLASRAWHDGGHFECHGLPIGIRGQPVIKVGSRGAFLTKVDIWNKTTDSHLSYQGKIRPGEVLVLDCGRLTAEIRGQSVYRNLVVDTKVVLVQECPTIRWFQLRAGENRIAVEADATTAAWWWSIEVQSENGNGGGPRLCKVFLPARQEKENRNG